MAVSADMSVDNANPAHGDTITVTYTVTGNDAIPPQGATIGGRVVVGGEPFDLSASVTMPGTPAAPKQYAEPVLAGVNFSATANPAVWTAVIP